MKKIIALLFALLLALLSMCGCGKKEVKTLHCDHCGKAVEVDADSQMEEDWILYCSECEKELGLDDIV